MQDLSGYCKPTLFSTFCQVSEGKYSPYLKSQEGNGVVSVCENPFGKNIITCKNFYKNEFIDEVQGLNLDLPSTIVLPDLPSYIPIYDKSKMNLDEEFVGVTLTDILKKGVILRAGMLHEQEIVINEGILKTDTFKSKKVILFLTGSDTLIEWVWYNRHDCNFFEKITQMGFFAVCGFNFSVIGGECAFSQALNQKRSLYSTFFAAAMGLQSIPHVYALNKYHVERWLNWFKLNPSVNYFVTNCQLQKKEYDINQVVSIIKCFLSQLPYMNVILQGFPLDRISDFAGLLDRIHFADKGAIKYAQARTKIYHNIEKNTLMKSYSNDGFENLVRNNIDVKRFYIEYNKAIYRNKIAA
jgi:hypothetical protein